jgi:anionic cell wall polymer biosynthesis LytR-Cps2A-Psr (LCP) family protein
VTVEEDFSEVDPSIGMGEVKLNGRQAVNFLRSRQNVGDQLNLTRMQRQERYMSSFVKLLKEKLQTDPGFAVQTFDTVADYMVTELSSSALVGLVEHYSGYEMGKFYSVPGQNVVGEYMEYHVDEAELDKLIIDLLYNPKG